MKSTITPRKEFIKLFNSLMPEFRSGRLWHDFIALTAHSLLEPVCVIRPDIAVRSTAEAEIKRIRECYSPEHIAVFENMFVQLVMELENNPWQDLLGSLWAELEVNSQSDKQFKGQFFTPFHVSEAMALIGMQGMEELIEKQGFIRLNEPTCGAGGMITAAAKVLLDRGYNPQKVLHVTAQDIDINCVYMTYIQMTLLGLPGVVICGDTLLAEQRSVWPTLFHHLYFWEPRLRKVEQQERQVECEVTEAEYPAFIIDSNTQQLGFNFM